MPRKPRIHYPGALYHCINRGNRRKAIYGCDNDYLFMQDCLANAVEKHGALIHGYCLMTNHFHIIIQVHDVRLSTIMRSCLTRFAQNFNRIHHKTGHVFQGRYRAILCQKQSYLLELVRYVHLNPVRAHLVQDPQQWRWSSLNDYLHPSQHPWLHTRDILAEFGRHPHHHLLQFLSQVPDLDPAMIYPPESFPILGDNAFIKQVTEPVALRRHMPRSFPGRRLSLKQIAQAICEAQQFPIQQLNHPHKGPHQLSRIRQDIILAGRQFFFYKTCQLADFLNISSAAVTLLLNQLSSNQALFDSRKTLILHGLRQKYLNS